MALIFEIASSQKLDIQGFLDFVSIDDLKILLQDKNADITSYVLYRSKVSTTVLLIQYDTKGQYAVTFDQMSAYDDYRMLPYLLDSLYRYLNSEPFEITQTDESGNSTKLSAYQYLNEKWRETQISEIVAYAKCVMSLHLPYTIELPMDNYWYVTESVLNQYGVDLHSSTPRIYGYIQYLLREGLLPFIDLDEEVKMPEDLGEEIVVDVPKHVSIGTVQSWQTDGSITTESFCAQDVALLVNIGQRYEAGASVEGVVLNDLGTIYQEGIGVEKDVDMAIKWFNAAINEGDHTFAPSSLGDIYRKGTGKEGVQLRKAFETYMKGDDPYAQFRIGQAFEEGWNGTPQPEVAMEWYKKAASRGHHLALKRLNRDK